MFEQKPGDVTIVNMIGHATTGVGLNLIFGIWATFMMIFYTDVLGISAAAAGMIMMFTRFWDAINDPLMGMIADNTRTKWGRYRPYLLFVSIPLAIMVSLCFYAPDLSYTGKVIYATLTYLFMSMTFTAIDIPYWSMPAVMSQDLYSRTKILSISRGACTITWRCLGIILMPLILFLGDGNQSDGYFKAAILIGIVCAICMNIGFFTIKENVQPSETQKKSGFSLKKTINVLLCNKPLMMIILSNFLVTILGLISSGIQVYYAQYILGDIALVSLFSALLLPGFLIGIAITPFLCRKYGLKNIYIAAQVLNAVACVGMYFATKDTVMVLYVFYALTALPSGISTIACSTMIANTIEYAEWKTGQRNEGLICSTQTFITKLCLALGTGLTGFVLSLSGYVPNAEQNETTINIIHFSFTLLPAVACLLSIIPVLFYELTDKRYHEIITELAQRRALQKDELM